MSEQSTNIDVEKLRELIGTKVHYNGRACQIIEVLEDGPALVLQHSETATQIQADQHGEAHRKVPTITTIPVFEKDNGGYSQAFNDLNLGCALQ